MSVRTLPPLPGDLANRGQRKREDIDKFCRLCARPGLPSRQFKWHPKCSAIASTFYRRGGALNWLERRDGMKCRTCGVPLQREQPPGPHDWWSAQGRTYEHTGADHRPYWMTRLKINPPVGSIWFYPMGPTFAHAEVDHVIPLWKVATLEPRRVDHPLRYWMPGNLQLLCAPCHRAKTKAEAAERAALRAPGPRHVQEELRL